MYKEGLSIDDTSKDKVGTVTGQTLLDTGEWWRGLASSGLSTRKEVLYKGLPWSVVVIKTKD